MNWKFTGDRPVYLQIMAAVQGAILTGQWQPGQKIPSVRDLASQAKVNPNTMQRALTELEREGLLVGAGTTGRTVTTRPEILEAAKYRALKELAMECAEKFALFGVGPAEAAALLLQLEKEEF